MFGQETFASRITAGVSIISTQYDYRAFTNSSLGFGLEATCDITRNENSALNFRGFLNYFAVSGKERPELETTLSLNGMSLGAEVLFKTPWEKVVPHAGVMLTKWSASHDGLGILTESQAEFDSSPKFGWRVGVDYSITRNIIVGAAFSMSEWRSHADYTTGGTILSTILPGYSFGAGTVVKGWNPVNPSWLSINGRWRF
jgi:hypothetical protein